MNKPIIIHPALFKPGQKPVFKNRNIFIKQLNGLDGKFNIAFYQHDPKRTLPQNKYYWKVMIGDPMKHGSPSNYFGIFPDDLHELYKEKFNNGKSTTKLSIEGFWDYIESIKIFLALEYNIVLPDPDQVLFL